MPWPSCLSASSNAWWGTVSSECVNFSAQFQPTNTIFKRNRRFLDFSWAPAITLSDSAFSEPVQESSSFMDRISARGMFNSMSSSANYAASSLHAATSHSSWVYAFPTTFRVDSSSFTMPRSFNTSSTSNLLMQMTSRPSLLGFEASVVTVCFNSWNLPHKILNLHCCSTVTTSAPWFPPLSVPNN